MLDDGTAFARAAGVRAPTSLEAVALARAMSKAESNNDLDALAPVMTWQDGATESIGFTLSGRFPSQGEAAKIQVKVCMAFLLETFRAADTTQESSIRDILPAIRNLKKVHALDQEFKTDLQDFTFVADALEDAKVLAPHMFK